jgi:hypothetical protein
VYHPHWYVPGTRSLFAVAAVLAALPFTACGSSSRDSDHPSPTPSASGPVIQGSTLIPGNGFLPVTLTTTASGTLTIQLGLTPNIVMAGVVTSGCTAPATRAACRTLSYTEGTSSDSSKTVIVPGAAAGTYLVMLGNVAPGGQTVSYTVTLTTS